MDCDLAWWTLGTGIATAAATFLAVLAALFGEVAKKKWFPPKLALRLIDPQGEPVLALLSHPEAPARYEDGRFYHIRVSNKKRHNTATGVEVYLTRIEAPNADDVMVTSWAGELPLEWKGFAGGSVARDVGQDRDVDLCSIIKDKWLRFHPILAPFNFPGEYRPQSDKRVKLIATVQAKSIEVDSEPLRISIVWDGQWSDDLAIMANHAILKEIQ